MPECCDIFVVVEESIFISLAGVLGWLSTLEDIKNNRRLCGMNVNFLMIWNFAKGAVEVFRS